MNQIVTTLIAEAGLEWCAQTEQDKQNLEEFADLIIKECISVIAQNSDPFAPTPYENNIQEHFGVGK
jgi:hypothetical protein